MVFNPSKVNILADKRNTMRNDEIFVHAVDSLIHSMKQYFNYINELGIVSMSYFQIL